MNMIVAGAELQTANMDHHGLVAAVCQELGIAKRIDEKLWNGDERRVISPGKAVVAMILNGLGFTNRRLYLTHQFYEDKPLDRLLDADIKAKDITDYTLGHTLDEIASYGATQLFGELSFNIALEHDLLGMNNHLDTTSISVQGKYENQSKAEKVQITHGYSKDHRPDLKQVVLSLVVNGPSNIPLWMEPLSGNSSDQKSFHQTIENVNKFKQQLNIEKNFKWIADSALYTKEHLLKENDYLWLTRVPERIQDAKFLKEEPKEALSWTEHEGGYSTVELCSIYGGIKQRWLLVQSDQAYKREKKTLLRKLDTQEKQLKKSLWHLSNEKFSCALDAEAALAKLSKKNPCFTVKHTVHTIERYAQKGRPSKDQKKEVVGYQIKGVLSRNETHIAKILCRKGRFILATNDLDYTQYPPAKLLEEYKQQQNVEGGFRFLKDPWFMVDSVFLKSPKRIEALMMVMTLCLLVYNIAQYNLREKLRKTNDTLPNQIKKKVQNPTMRWIFQIMEGISVVRIYDSATNTLKTYITNLTDLRKKIIQLFGRVACRIYGLIHENEPQVLGM
jgi:transposase